MAMLMLVTVTIASPPGAAAHDVPEEHQHAQILEAEIGVWYWHCGRVIAVQAVVADAVAVEATAVSTATDASAVGAIDVENTGTPVEVQVLVDLGEIEIAEELAFEPWNVAVKAISADGSETTQEITTVPSACHPVIDGVTLDSAPPTTQCADQTVTWEVAASDNQNDMVDAEITLTAPGGSPVLTGSGSFGVNQEYTFVSVDLPAGTPGGSWSMSVVVTDSGNRVATTATTFAMPEQDCDPLTPPACPALNGYAPAASANPQVVGWWPFDNSNPYGRLTDGQNKYGPLVESGGAAENTAGSPGNPAGQSEFFDGSSEAMINPITLTPSLDGASTVTIETWVQTTDDHVTLIENRSSGEDFPAAPTGWTLLLYSNGSLEDRILFQASGPGNINTFSSPVPNASDGGWHRVTVVRDAATTLVFLDGELVGSGASSSGPLMSSINELTFGHGLPDSDTADLNGSLDEVAIWVGCDIEVEPQLEAAITVSKITYYPGGNGFGASIPFGSPIEWRVHITNTGDVEVTTLEAIDDPEGPYDCGGVTTLQPGQSVTCSVFGTALLGLYENVVTVNGTSSLGDVQASSNNRYTGIQPDGQPVGPVVVEKYTNDQLGDIGQVDAGSVVQWAFKVTNNTNQPLMNLSVIDDVEGAAVCEQGGVPVTEVPPGSFVWCYVAAGTAIDGVYENTVTVTGVIEGFGEVADTSTGSYTGVPEEPVVECPSGLNVLFVIDNSGSISDANFALFTAGATAIGDMLIGGTGDVNVAVAHYALAGLSIERDFSATPMTLSTVKDPGLDIGDDLGFAMGHIEDMLDNGSTPAVLTAGSLPSLNPNPAYRTHIVMMTDGAWGTPPVLADGSYLRDLRPTATYDWDIYDSLKSSGKTLSVVRIERTVDHAEVAAIASPGGTWTSPIAANANDPQPGASPRRYWTQASFDVSQIADDIALDVVADCNLDVEKTTNGSDDPSQVLTEGDVVTWEYLVTNNSTTSAITNVEVVDDQEGAVCTITTLAPGTSQVCTLTGVAVEGVYTNIVTVTGDLANHGPVSAVDSSGYTGEAGGCSVLGTTVPTDLPQIECDALVALYNSTTGASWSDNTGWLSATDPCTWEGVTCHPGTVRRLYLQGNNLSGSLPVEIGDLSGLERLYVQGNDLSGVVPVEIGQLTALERLYLQNNDLSGSLPAELGDLLGLEQLYVHNNDLSGPIPPEIGDLSNLVRLYVQGNDLSGPIPSEIGDLLSLQRFYAHRNDLTSIPSEIGDLVSLERLYLHKTDITSIPSEVGDLASLERLYLYTAQLAGPIPVELGDLLNLTHLYLQKNDLTGPIPSELGDLSNLQRLYLQSNDLTGMIPSELGDLTSLVRLQIQFNTLTGSLPDELGDLDNLEHLVAHRNQLRGDITIAIAGVSDTLVNLKLTDGNNFNDCLTATGAAATYLNITDPDWDRCDNP